MAVFYAPTPMRPHPGDKVACGDYIFFCFAIRVVLAPAARHIVDKPHARAQHAAPLRVGRGLLFYSGDLADGGGDVGVVVEGAEAFGTDAYGEHGDEVAGVAGGGEDGAGGVVDKVEYFDGK